MSSQIALQQQVCFLYLLRLYLLRQICLFRVLASIIDNDESADQNYLMGKGATGCAWGEAELPPFIAYDASGNLTNKEGVALSYGSTCGASGIHAVCKAVGANGTDQFAYDANGNIAFNNDLT